MRLTAQMKNGIAGTDVRKESISQTLSFGGTLHEAGNVHYVQEGGHLAVKLNKHFVNKVRNELHNNFY